MLQFIEKEYWEYLDGDAIVSYQTLMQEHQKLKGKLNFVKAQLLATNSNEVLLNIAFKPFEKMILTNTNQKLTYNEFCYASQYIIEINHYFKTKPEIAESDLSGLLFNLNLNSLQLFEYYIDEIILEMNQCESDSDKINILYHKLKTINQKRLKIKTVFNAAYPSIKVQIKSWIEEEIEYLNWKLKAKSFSYGVSIVEKDKPKMQTDLSVAQLSYLFSLLNQSGVVKHNNQREIFRFIADNFQTKTTSEISVASIKNRYYDAESSTQSAVRDKILQLLNLTKS